MPICFPPNCDVSHNSKRKNRKFHRYTLRNNLVILYQQGAYKDISFKKSTYQTRRKVPFKKSFNERQNNGVKSADGFQFQALE